MKDRKESIVLTGEQLVTPLELSYTLSFLEEKLLPAINENSSLTGQEIQKMAVTFVHENPQIKDKMKFRDLLLVSRSQLMLLKRFYRQKVENISNEDQQALNLLVCAESLFDEYSDYFKI